MGLLLALGRAVRQRLRASCSVGGTRELSWRGRGQQQCDQMRLGADGPPFLWADVLREPRGWAPARSSEHRGTQAGRHLYVQLDAL